MGRLGLGVVIALVDFKLLAVAVSGEGVAAMEAAVVLVLAVPSAEPW